MTTRLASIPVLLLVACGDPSSGVDDPDAGLTEQPDAAPPGPATGIARCAEEGRAPTSAWAVDNQHGEVRSMTTDPTGLVVLGSVDRTVKVWQFGFGGASPLEAPGYGTPYEPGAGIARALAFSADGAWLAGGDDTGELSAWWADEGDLRARLDAGDQPISAVAFLDADQAFVADESFGGALRVWDLDGETLGAILETPLWGVSDAVVDGDALYVAGNDYGNPSVELRAAGSPDGFSARWVDLDLQSQRVRVAVTADRVFAAGSGFIAVLPRDLSDAQITVVADLDAVAVAATPDGGVLAVLDAAGTIRLHDTTGAERTRVDVAPSVGVSFDATGEALMAAGSDGWLRSFGCAE